VKEELTRRIREEIRTGNLEEVEIGKLEVPLSEEENGQKEQGEIVVYKAKTDNDYILKNKKFMIKVTEHEYVDMRQLNEEDLNDIQELSEFKEWQEQLKQSSPKGLSSA